VRAERDLYAQAVLEDLVARACSGRPGDGRGPPPFSYVPVLSEPTPEWQGARGWVHEAVLENISDLNNHDVYAAGPPAMIAAVRRDFVKRGADPNRLFFDSFDYAPDALERQRSSAATKS
jgi:NAD(P)H-flavin reductase